MFCASFLFSLRLFLFSYFRSYCLDVEAVSLLFSRRLARWRRGGRDRNHQARLFVVAARKFLVQRCDNSSRNISIPVIPGSVIALLGKQTTGVGLSSSDVERGTISAEVSRYAFLCSIRASCSEKSKAGNNKRSARANRNLSCSMLELDAKIYRLGRLIMMKRNANGNPIVFV